MSDTANSRPRHFIREMVETDLASGKYAGRVVTRFPPEPNGYLHIGHAKSICLNFGMAQEYGGRCNLRFDDTNPTTEDPEYVESIIDDIHWLGFDWGEQALYASDYFEQLYAYGVELIERGLAYVDSSTEEEIRTHRGTVTRPGDESPYRTRGIEENLDLFRRMRAGEFEDGAHVLRARIDMGAANMKMRDPLLYRIRHAHHYRSGDDWCIYPMYDFAHCLSDAVEKITHSLCTLEFENNRQIYDWVLANTSVDRPPPEQTEFARLNLTYTVLSKRKLLELVEGDFVDGWDDPRMPTIRGFRHRGYTPASIRNFCEAIGVAKANSVVDVAQLEHAVRDDLNQIAPRVLAVLRPLKVVITNYPEGKVEQLEAPYFPHDIGKEGSRLLPFTRELLIERDDFEEEPPKGFRRLAPGREVRLRYAYFIRCEEVVKNHAGEVVELRCTYDATTRGGSAADGRKVSGTLHWVSVTESVPIEARLYDRLFRVPHPGADKDGPDFKELLNPDSLERLVESRAEPSLLDLGPGSRVQFERLGYFYWDPQQEEGARPVLNRTVQLRDTWAKQSERGRDADASRQERTGRPAADAKPGEPGRPRALSVAQQERADRYRTEHDLTTSDAERLARDPDAGRFFEAAITFHAHPKTIANWLLNELRGGLKRDGTQLEPRELAALVALIDADRLSGKLAKQVLAEMLESGETAAAVVDRLGLEQIGDDDALRQAVEDVLERNPEQLEAFRGGKVALKGFFVGQVMQATEGRANPQKVQQLLDERLAVD
ncbi:MAG: glutamine--tRNA ligase/YqeY domain fusion protein [Deltaproteobacteria bacterium]|nr:glutamine--tRNA ligase/YqeY domain fusion protein [Deltaproteobacteria bacterium]